MMSSSMERLLFMISCGGKSTAEKTGFDRKTGSARVTLAVVGFCDSTFFGGRGIAVLASFAIRSLCLR